MTFEDRTDRQQSFDSCALAYLLTKSSAMCSIGAQMDSLETGTKAYMALYPEGSTDGGENIQKCCFLVYVVKHLSHDAHLLYFHCQAFVWETSFPTLRLTRRKAIGIPFMNGRKESGPFSLVIQRTSRLSVRLRLVVSPSSMTSCPPWTVWSPPCRWIP